MNKSDKKMLDKGPADWNRWREANRIKVPDLQKCDLRCRDLRDFNLEGANLEGANLKGANLKRADLWNAELCGAKLVGTNMMGVTISVDRLLCADLWESESVSSDKDGREVLSVDKWIGECRRVRKANRQHQRHRPADEHHPPARQHGEYTFYYRGAKCYCCHRPIPSVMRNCIYREHESDMLTDLMGRRPEDFEKETMALDQWSLARHYDLPTRLLDVTSDPLVALYFASKPCKSCCKDRNCRGDGRLDVFKVHSDLIKRFNSDTIRVISNFAKLDHRRQDAILKGCGGKGSFCWARGELYQNIRQERPQFEELIDPRHFLQVFVVKPRQSFERIRAQSGAFLVSAYHGNLSSSEVGNKMGKSRDLIPLYRHWKLRVPSGRKSCILDDLSMLNVTAERLFPSLETAVEAVKKEHSCLT